MITILLDTSVVVEALNVRAGTRRFLQDPLLAGHTLACCAITTAEVYAGTRRHEAMVSASPCRDGAAYWV